MNEERVCKNCGEVIPINERKCPKCGRLSVDSRTSRLGMESPIPPPTDRVDDISAKAPISSTDSTAPTPQGDAAKESPGEAKPDSYYAVAPQTFSECPQCGGPVSYGTCRNCGYQAPSKGSKCGGCGPCVVFLFLIGWLFTLIALI